MSEKQRKPQTATQDDLEALKQRLETEASEQATASAEASVAAPEPVESVESAGSGHEGAQLSFGEAVARRKEIRVFLDPIFAARTALRERDDIPKGGFRKEWFAGAKPLLAEAGYPVADEMSQREFFEIIEGLKAEDQKLKVFVEAERAKRPARQPRSQDSGAPAAPKQRERRPNPKGGRPVTQATLDRMESRTRVWEIDADEDDLVAREKARRAMGRRIPVAAEETATKIEVTNEDHNDTVDSILDARRAKHVANGYGALEDIVDFDDNLVAHHGKGMSGRRSGGFMSKADLELIKQYQDVIRDGMAERQVEYAEHRKEVVRNKRRPVAPSPESFGTDESGRPLAPAPEAFGIDGRPVAPSPESFGTTADGSRPVAPSPESFGTEGRPVAPSPESFDTGDEMTDERLEALQAAVAEARDDYARLTAKDRSSYFGRFLKADTRFSRFLRRITPIRALANKVNDRQSREKDEAQAAYEGLVDRLNDSMSAEVAGSTPEQLLAMRKAWLINESLSLEQRVAVFAKESSKKAGVLTNWWMSQEGKRFGKLKKAAVIALGSGVAAAGVTVLMPGVIFGLATGTIAGGMTGGFMGHRVTKRRQNAIVEGPDGTFMRFADREALASQAAHRTTIDEADSSSASVMTGTTEAKSDAEMLRNRKRFNTAKGIGMVAGGLAGFGVGRLHEAWDTQAQRAEQADAARKTAEQRATDAETARKAAEEKAKALQDQLDQRGGTTGSEVPAPGPEVLKANTFTVESGNGLIREWSQWATANGHQIDPQTAEQLHQTVLNRFGQSGVIDLNGVPTNLETYTQAGDVRISTPGTAEWRPGVADFARDWLKSQGKW